MATEEWEVHAKLTGEFFIIDEQFFLKEPLVEGLRQLSIFPKFSDNGKRSGHHELKALLSLENKVDTPLASHVVYEQAKNLVDNVTALATLGIGRPVLVSDGISVKRRLIGDPPKYRLIVHAAETGSFGPPTNLPAKLLMTPIDSKIKRVIRWFAHGLSTSDPVDQLIALNNALELLSGMHDCTSVRVRTCKSCGAEEEIGPGLRERVVNFLTGMLGYTQEVASDVYESRLDLTHARSSLTEDDLRRYRNHAILVANAVRTGVARALAINLPPISMPFPFDLPSAILDIEYVEGPKAQGSSKEPK